MNKKVVILYPEIKDKNKKDQIDTLEQLNLIKNSLKKLKYETYTLECSLNLLEISKSLIQINPDFCFNLVDCFYNDDRMITIIPLLLESLNIPYTSPNSENMFITTNKVLCKKMFILNKISTPAFIYNNKTYGNISFPEKFIIKQVSSDGSINIDEKNIFLFKDLQSANQKIREFTQKYNKDFFAEIYINGREFNVSLLCFKDKLEILPISEIIFKDYPEEKPKIVCYKAKWLEDSFEYKNTIRNFNFSKQDEPLLKQIEEISSKCYDLFGLRGYARIDIRVENNNIYILEININPSLSMDAGFVASAKKKGISFEELIKKIIETI